MISDMLIWATGAPLVLTLTTLALASLRARDEEVLGRRQDIVVPLALGLAYAVGHMGLQGAPGLGIEGGLLTISLGGAGLSMALAQLKPRPWLTTLVRFTAAAAAAWVLLSPLAQPQAWTTAQYATNLGITTVAVVAVWLGLERLLERAPGQAATLALIVLVAGSSGVVVMGTLASTARLLAPLAAGLGTVFLLSLPHPQRRLLRTAAPLLSLTTVSHWAAAMFYGELPPVSLSLLVLAPLPLLVLRSRAVLQAGRIATLAAALGLAAVPLAGAAVPAAMNYFGDGSTPGDPSSGDSDSDESEDNYGY